MFNNLIIVVWEAASRVEAILHGECMYAWGMHVCMCNIYVYILLLQHAAPNRPGLHQ